MLASLGLHQHIEDLAHGIDSKPQIDMRPSIVR
jgi:hypothetical protein